jgi:hypothetical protein
MPSQFPVFCEKLLYPRPKSGHLRLLATTVPGKGGMHPPIDLFRECQHLSLTLALWAPNRKSGLSLPALHGANTLANVVRDFLPRTESGSHT